MTEETQTEIKKTEAETEMVSETGCRGFCGKNGSVDAICKKMKGGLEAYDFERTG